MDRTVRAMTPFIVAVRLMGGWSAEREVSLMSGAGVADALEVARAPRDTDRHGPRCRRRLPRRAPDVVFNALHGTPGEDGSVQGLLDLMGLTYTHSGLATSVIAIDKVLTKQALVPHGIPMPGGRIVKTADAVRGRSAAAALCAETGQRRVVGRRGDRHRRTAITAIRSRRASVGPWQEFDELLAEPFIRGRELTTAVLGDRAMGVTELKPKSGFYDYDSKYTDGLTEHVYPADIPDEITEACKALALEAHRLLGLQGRVARRFPLGRRARRGRAVPARGQHPAGHDAAEPRARTGAA